ncbi:MAG: hypothetical protein ABR987_24595 [Terracidiphilus sp.]|jgi:hypothetical protein
MKKFTIIGFSIVLLIIGALLFWHHAKRPSVPPKMDLRVYKITPEVFFSHLSQKLSPKDGETHSQLLIRFFEEHHIDIQKPPDSLAVSDEKGMVFVKATSREQSAIENLVAQLNKP